MLNVLSLFSGIGAYEKALTRIGANFSLVAYSEIDKFASKSYSAIHGVNESFNLGDVGKIDTSPLREKRINLISQSFPCTDVSIAGRQAGFGTEDNRTRTGLFFEATRIIQDLQPEFAIAENVEGLVQKKFEANFQECLQSLDEIGQNTYWKILDAKDFGIPQSRRRVFMISIRKDIDTGLIFPDGFPLQKPFASYLETDVDPKYYLSKAESEYMSRKVKGGRTHFDFRYHHDTDNETCSCLTANIHKGVPQNVVIDRVIQIGNCKPTKTRDNPNQGRIYDTCGLCPTLNCMGGGNRQPYFWEGGLLRKMTPKECFRLMGFTDEDYEKCVAAKISPTQIYKQSGNSIVVNVLVSLFTSLSEQNKMFKEMINQ